MALLTIGEVRENVAKALTCPEHIDSIVQALYGKGTVLTDKRKGLTEKYNKRKRKLVPEPLIDAVEEEPSFPQDMN